MNLWRRLTVCRHDGDINGDIGIFVEAYKDEGAA